MREMKDSGVEWIGEIPVTWNVYRNKNAFVCSKDLVGRKSSGTQLLSLTTKGIKLKDINNAEGKLPESFDTYQYVKKDEMVMCLFDLDCSAVFSGLNPYDGMISPAYKVLTCTDRMEPKYADYWFQYISHGRKFNHYAKNIRYTLSYEEFSALPMLFPGREEQIRISNYLDAKCSKINEIIEKQQAIIEKLREFKLAKITEIVTRGLEKRVELKEINVEWVGQIPKSWKLCHIGMLAEIGSGGTPDRKKRDYWDGEIPWMASGEINYEYVYDTVEKITELGMNNSNTKILPINTVMLGLIGQGKTKGMTAILKIESTCNQNLAYLIPNKELLHYEYLFYCFKAMYIYMRGIVGESQAGIYQGFLKKQYIPLPPIDTQIKISELLNSICSKVNRSIQNREQIIEELNEYKKSLIYEVVTGKKEV